MINIETKKMPNGKWSSFATFQGYDHAFVTDSMEDSQQQMRDELEKRNLQGNFLDPVIYPPNKTVPKHQWRPPMLDHLN